MPGRDGRLDLTLTDPTGAAYMGDRAITLSLYAIGGEDDILAAKTRLAALAGTIVSLSWRSLPGEYQGRMSLGAWEDKWAGDHQIATLVQAEIDATLPDRPQPIHRAQNGREHDPRQRQPAMLAHMDAHPRRRRQDRQHQGRARPQTRRHVHHRHHRTHLHRHRPRPPGAARQRQPHDTHTRIRLLPPIARPEHAHPHRSHRRQSRVQATHTHLGAHSCDT